VLGEGEEGLGSVRKCYEVLGEGEEGLGSVRKCYEVLGEGEEGLGSVRKCYNNTTYPRNTEMTERVSEGCNLVKNPLPLVNILCRMRVYRVRHLFY